jgi:hypothetical protein
MTPFRDSREMASQEVEMNTTLTTTVLFGTLLLGLSASTARAGEVARVTVPFPFDVNGHTLPAGRYDVRIDDQNPAIVRIDGTTNHKLHAVVATTIPDYGRGPGDNPTLTFVRKDNQYRLTTIWESRDYGRDIVHRK